MNIGSWPARRIFWFSLLWELALTAIFVMRAVFLDVDAGGGAAGVHVDSVELLAMLFLMIAPPLILIAVWLRQGKYGIVKALKILFAVVLSFVCVVALIAAGAIALFSHGFAIGFGIERTH